MNDKPKEILIVLNEHFGKGTIKISEIAKVTDSTYCYTHDLLYHYRVLGWVKLVKSSRIVDCSLTDRGREIAEAVIELKILCEDD